VTVYVSFALFNFSLANNLKKAAGPPSRRVGIDFCQVAMTTKPRVSNRPLAAAE